MTDVEVQESDPTSSSSGRVTTQVPQWKTVFTVTVLLVAIITISALPKTSSEGRAGVVVATTALLWCTEAMPLMVTALLPAILFPFAGTLTAKAACAKYYNDISMLLLGTFLFAESVEASGLHRRIALGILSLVGRSEALLMLGAQLVTWKLSMFMSNTATTAMMLPIIRAIIESLRKIQNDVALENKNAGDVALENKNADDEEKIELTGEKVELAPRNKEEEEEGVEPPPDSPQFTWFCKGLILSIPYGASIGGIATLTGTPPNLVFTGQFIEKFPEGPTIDYGKWVAFAYPISLLVVLVGWHVLVIMYARDSYSDLWAGLGKLIKPQGARVGAETTKWGNVNQIIRKQYRKLGSIRFPEGVLFVLMGALFMLWLFRNPAGIQGWAKAHANVTYVGTGEPPIYLSDSWVVITVAIIIFNIPTENPLKGTWLWTPPPGKKFARSGKLLNMEIVMSRTPWDVIILLGGGYAIAEGCDKSGLSKWLGNSFGFLSGQEPVVIALVISALVAFLTEVTSNTASTTLLMPILAEMSKTLKLNPLYLMLTGTISASLAFCLPSATAPNAMVFSFKEIGVMDMLRTGVIMNLCSVLIVVLGLSTWTRSIMNITEEFPDWANN